MDAIKTLVTFLASNIWGLAIGFLASLLASFAFARWREQRKWKEYQSLLGFWVEANNLLNDRPFSICEFFLTSKGELVFEGSSYDNNGDEYYKWTSIVLHVDDVRRRISYVYSTYKVDTPSKTDEGFGCIFLHRDPDNNKWNCQRGYFLDLEEATPRDARMIRFEKTSALFKLDLNPSSRDDRKVLIKKLLSNKANQTIKQHFRW